MKNWRKIASAALAVVMTVGLCPIFPATAEKPEHILNYRDIDFRFPKGSVGTAPQSLPAAKAGAETQSYYSSVTAGRVSPVRDQDPHGTCWAFSATASAESALLAQGSHADLSEAQLINFFYNKKYDPLGNANGDETICKDAEGVLKIGGNSNYTIWSLASWTNGALEESLPYNDDTFQMIENGTVPQQYANDFNVAHLQDAYSFSYSGDATSKALLKEMVVKYGSVSCAYFHDKECYDEDTGAYFCKTQSYNHVVAIVGWNDNYDRNNFNSASGKKPNKKGAWLVRNSWGTNWGTDGDGDGIHSGKEGYFWLSYEDYSLIYSEDMFVFDFDITHKYQYNYQYDGSNGNSYYEMPKEYISGATYTVAGLTSDKERLDAVGIGLGTTNCSGTVSVYVNTPEDDPDDGEPVLTQSFTTQYAGFNTIPLKNGPVLKKGDTYSVIFQFDHDYILFLDSSYNGNWIEFVADTSKDRTFDIHPTYGYEDWSDLEMTARIKAFTNDVDPVTHTLTYDGNGTTENVPKPTVKRLKEATVLSEQTPTRAGYQFAGWSEDKTAATATIRPGGLYTSDENKTVYAVWNKIPVEEATASPTALELTVGAQPESVTLSVTPDDAIGIWTVENATENNGDFTYCGVVVSPGENPGEFLLHAATYEQDTVEIVFVEQPSNKTVTVTVTIHAPPATVLYGDCNLNGVVDANDLTELAKHVAKIMSISDPKAILAADVTGDGTISADDLTKMAKYIAKIISDLTPQK